MRVLFAGLLCILFFSCKKLFTYSANEIQIDEKDRNQNIQNIERLRSKTQNASFRFVVITDTQRFYDEMDDFIKKINAYPDISFLVLVGDVTDFGLRSEYLWICQRLQKLSFPFIVVIGNHDMLGNGRELYKQMFGPENFGFSYSGYKFIVVNSNSQEVGYNGSLPDTSWLQQELSATPAQEKIFVFAHLAPFSGDFDRSLEQAYVRTLTNNGNVLYSIHGHEDISYLGQPYGPPVNYLVVNSLKARSFVIINITANGITVEEVFF
ncbi:MAG TPA: metallophosphoesterase [Chitinophagaceae bacterium]|jgi:predicted phosphodiesterase|nr:metallophosphoesterase [Chitinophagaceae bacterium]